MPKVVTLSAHRFEGAARPWALWQMGAARLALMRRGGPTFWKLCGSGTGAGFRPRPNPSVAVILAAWPSRAAAEAGLDGAPWRAWRARAAEHCTLVLGPRSSRGAWGGVDPFGAAPPAGPAVPVGARGGRPAGEESQAGRIGARAPAGPDGVLPVASITRATLRPWGAGAFWARVPRLDDLVGENAEVLFRIGVGEVPWLRQGTFSVWPSEAAMARYARTGPHAEAIRLARERGWFREALYARFDVLEARGTWAGRPPLGAPPAAAA